MVKKQKKSVRRKSGKKKKSTFSKLAKKYIFLSTLFLCCLCFLYVFYCTFDMPGIDDAFQKTRFPSTTIVAENGHEIQTFGNSFSRVVYLEDLPDYVPSAVIDVEDRRFYAHFGVGVIGLFRAVVTNLVKKRYAQGASTITQQVAKNLFLK